MLPDFTLTGLNLLIIMIINHKSGLLLLNEMSVVLLSLLLTISEPAESFCQVYFFTGRHLNTF